VIDPNEFSPWDFWRTADADSQRKQLAHQAIFAARPDHEIAADTFISELASVDNDRLILGDRSYIAAGVYTTGDLEIGADCSINAYAVVRGRVRFGDGVRVGAHTSILGFNHTMEDPTLPVFAQPLVSRGITLGDDVWVGSHVIILDGVTVGDHTVLAAGAVVTKDVPDGAIVGGNPARFLKWRIPPADTDAMADTLAAFSAQVRVQMPRILERAWSPSAGLFANQPDAAPSVRAQTDAVELASLILGGPPPQLDEAHLIGWLRDLQDPETGLVASLAADGSSRIPDRDDPDVAYHVLCVGYALDLLGSSFAHPIRLLADSSADALTSFLDSLPWADRAWHAGHWTDAIGTALHWTLRRGDPVPDGYREALVGWLTMHADPATGMWGKPGAGGDVLEIVNGFYRTSRGTVAQFGVPLPYPKRVIDTVLQHARSTTYFDPQNHDACNVLDVAHPLWLTFATGHRSAEVRELALDLLTSALSRWVDDEGFAFRAGTNPDDPSQAPSLQGTEMWLATVWYLADVCGYSDALGYHPRGIHRPEPAGTLTT
jgi:acetyltransferase-like isoleucine patch superfamily enzyme